MRIKTLVAVAFLVLLVGTVVSPQVVQACDDQDQYVLARGFVVRDYCVVSLRHRHLNFFLDFPAQNPDGTVMGTRSTGSRSGSSSAGPRSWRRS